MGFNDAFTMNLNSFSPVKSLTSQQLHLEWCSFALGGGGMEKRLFSQRLGAAAESSCLLQTVVTQDQTQFMLTKKSTPSSEGERGEIHH